MGTGAVIMGTVAVVMGTVAVVLRLVLRLVQWYWYWCSGTGTGTGTVVPVQGQWYRTQYPVQYPVPHYPVPYPVPQYPLPGTVPSHPLVMHGTRVDSTLTAGQFCQFCQSACANGLVFLGQCA